MCSAVSGLHYFVCRSDKVHFCHITFFQKRIDFVKQITRYHRLKITARLFTFIFVFFFIFSIGNSLRSVLFSFYHNNLPKIKIVYILYIVFRDLSIVFILLKTLRRYLNSKITVMIPCASNNAGVSQKKNFRKPRS